MELLQEEPPLLQIYDVISDKWIADLKNTAKPSLRRPPPVGNDVQILIISQTHSICHKMKLSALRPDQLRMPGFVTNIFRTRLCPGELN